MSKVEIPGPTQSPQATESYGMLARIALIICLLGVIGYAGNAWWGMHASTDYLAANEATVVRAMGIVDPSPKHLAAEFTDSQGRLLADPPKDASQLLDPATIVLAHLADSDSETQAMNWPAVEKQIADATGRKVVDQIFDNGPPDLEQIKSGKITLVALHAADTPFLVNNYGFEPIAVMGDEGGANGNKLDLIVPTNSRLTTAGDVKGHNLTCSVPSSITGYRAAVALLLQDQKLRPNVDYFVIWSLKMKDSIKGIADGKFEVAAISDDKLQSMLEKGSIKETNYRTIYTSDVIPRTTIGSFYNLKPELAGKIRDAIFSFKPVVSSDADTGDKPMQFLPVDYKKDFALVREIDDRFDPRLDTKTKTKKASAPTTSP